MRVESEELEGCEIEGGVMGWMLCDMSGWDDNFDCESNIRSSVKQPHAIHISIIDALVGDYRDESRIFRVTGLGERKYLYRGCFRFPEILVIEEMITNWSKIDSLKKEYIRIRSRYEREFEKERKTLYKELKLKIANIDEEFHREASIFWGPKTLELEDLRSASCNIWTDDEKLADLLIKYAMKLKQQFDDRKIFEPKVKEYNAKIAPFESELKTKLSSLEETHEHKLKLLRDKFDKKVVKSCHVSVEEYRCE